MTIQALEKAIENLEYKVAKLEFEVYEQRRTIGQLITEKADRKTENSSEIPNTYKPKDEPQTECDNDCRYRVDGLGCMRFGGCYKESE